MGETKFTPGPWDQRIDPASRHVRQITALRGAVSVGQTSRWLESDNTDESRANAHLIAAAPNLYARVADHANNCRVCNGARVISSADGTRSAPCPTCAEDRAALAKARGEA